MNTGNLREDVLTDDRSVGRIADATVSCNDVTDLHQCRLIDMLLDMHLVFEHHMDTAQRRITAALTESVDGDVKSGTTGFYSHQRVAYSHIVVVMGMELKLCSWIAVGHGFHVLVGVEGIENAECIRQQISQNALVFE